MTFQLSDEQVQILKQARPPGVSSLVRITAAAGTGKTTTLLKLAEECSRLGHKHITYVTFNRSAAADGKRRLSQTVPHIDARTLHSSAMMLLAQLRSEQVISEELLWRDDELQREIHRICGRDIDDFLIECYGEIDRRGGNKRASMKKTAEKQVVFFIFKTLTQFCRSNMSEEDFLNTTNKCRNYYPAELYHNGRGAKKPDGEKMGFLCCSYGHRVDFYANQAGRLWKKLATAKTYDFEMKRAQLLKLEIPGTCLLVDESQDMDACQVAWVAGQVKFLKQVFLVGDAAQTIYSFRGAKSKYLMELNNVIDCHLTKSWRFGSHLAKIANLVLLAKEKSPQTTGYTKTWQPYRINGAASLPGVVTTDNLFHNFPRSKTKVTLLAFANVALMVEAVSLMGFQKDDIQLEEGGQFSIPALTIDYSALPKFHINGRGENSGAKKWRQILNQISHLYNLFLATDSYTLPPALFPEFALEKMTWDSFLDQVDAREMNKYAATIHVVSQYEHQTMQAVHLFEENVMKNPYSAEEADVILSTVHAAKGMEWDHVQLCQDLVEIAKVKEDGPPVPLNRTSAKRQKTSRSTWQFDLKSWGDDINILYVACTRAKKTLSIPKDMVQLMQDCDILHQLFCAKQKPDSGGSSSVKSGTAILLGCNKALSNEDMINLYNDIVVPVRRECGVSGSGLLCSQVLYSSEPPEGGGFVDDVHNDEYEHENNVIGPSHGLVDLTMDDNRTPEKAGRSQGDDVICLDDTPQKQEGDNDEPVVISLE